MAKKAAASVYVFKVALKYNKRVWRKIALKSNQTLEELHRAIYAAFNRYEEHLYSFYFPPPGMTGQKAKRLAQEYTHPDCVEGPMDDVLQRLGATSELLEAAKAMGFNMRSPSLDATKTKLSTLGLTEKQKFQYLFDFGDEWWHEITVGQLDALIEEGHYPRVMTAKGDSPPQYG